MHTIEYMPPKALKPNPKNSRTHSQKQIRQIADFHKGVRLYHAGADRRDRHATCRSRTLSRRRSFST